jgi:hypothetical protein
MQILEQPPQAVAFGLLPTKEVYAAAQATIRFAATTGFAPSIRPYATHITAADACTHRSFAGAEKK